MVGLGGRYISTVIQTNIESNVECNSLQGKRQMLPRDQSNKLARFCHRVTKRISVPAKTQKQRITVMKNKVSLVHGADFRLLIQIRHIVHLGSVLLGKCLFALFFQECFKKYFSSHCSIASSAIFLRTSVKYNKLKHIQEAYSLISPLTSPITKSVS